MGTNYYFGSDERHIGKVTRRGTIMRFIWAADPIRCIVDRWPGDRITDGGDEPIDYWNTFLEKVSDYEQDYSQVGQEFT